MESTADFTARDMSRHFAKVIAACNRLGTVRIKHRNGETYQLKRETPPKKKAKPAYPDFAARRRALGMPMMTRQQRDTLDKLIRGE